MMVVPAKSTPLDRGLITVSIMLATIMQALDTTIANVALPHMQGSMAATQDQISWVLTSYIVSAAIMTPPTGVLAARFGRKRLFAIMVVGFTIASMLCGAATSLIEIVIYRLLQGAFGAGLVPLSQAVLLDTYPREKHGSAMAMWGVGVMVGPILGPTLGGYLTEVYNWRWVFYINLPFGILALLGILAFVPETERNRRRFDFVGFALLSFAIGALQMILDRGESQDWFSSTEIVIEAVLAGLFLYMFLVHMFTASEPFLEPGLFRDRNLAVGLFLIFMVGVILLATLALLPPFLQNLMGFPVLTTGYVLAPRGIGTMIAMVLVGRLIGRVDTRLLILLGIGLTALSLWEMSRFTIDIPISTIVWTGITQGLGLGFIFVPLSTITFSTLAPHYRNEGTAMFSLMRNIGSSIGISIVITLLAQNTQVSHADIANVMTPFRAMLQSPWLPQAWNWHTTPGMVTLNSEVTRQAAIIAYLNDFTLMMWVALLSAPLLLLLRKSQATISRGPAIGD
ncbi:MAG: DHA2 family efflux MFS transporter permease subunit [Alphaproteobacteria bacterium]